jgi:DNA-binding MarR family transcriptional regulator
LRQERQSDLTPTQLSVLWSIRELGAGTPSAIAALEQVRPPSITRSLNHLVEAGLAQRDPHPDDGRQVLISISDKGGVILDEERNRRDLWLAQRLAEFTPAEQDTLREAAALLDRLANR